MTSNISGTEHGHKEVTDKAHSNAPITTATQTQNQQKYTAEEPRSRAEMERDLARKHTQAKELMRQKKYRESVKLHRECLEGWEQLGQQSGALYAWAGFYDVACNVERWSISSPLAKYRDHLGFKLYLSTMKRGEELPIRTEAYKALSLLEAGVRV